MLRLARRVDKGSSKSLWSELLAETSKLFRVRLTTPDEPAAVVEICVDIAPVVFCRLARCSSCFETVEGLWMCEFRAMN